MTDSTRQAENLRALPGPVLGLDVGGRRLGVALLDPAAEGHVHPLTTIERGRGKDDWAALQRLVNLHATRGFVVGLPLLTSGAEGDQARGTRGYAKALRERYPRAWIALVDERETSREADEWLDELPLTAAGRRERRDALAAARILQNYLAWGPHDTIPISETD